jgi:hypothetical protein
MIAFSFPEIDEVNQVHWRGKTLLIGLIAEGKALIEWDHHTKTCSWFQISSGISHFDFHALFELGSHPLHGH